MKIAQIAPLYEAVPPSLYGGTERIVAHLTNALVELGHEVTLFASAEAQRTQSGSPRDRELGHAETSAADLPAGRHSRPRATRQLPHRRTEFTEGGVVTRDATPVLCL